MSNTWLTDQIAEHLRVSEAVQGMTPDLVSLAEALVTSFRAGGKAFFCGNGGSAADAQHWAAELSGRFFLDRPGLPAISLSVNTSEITAIGNDYGFEHVFARPLKGLACKGDILVAISTSGNSPNVVLAAETARTLGVHVAAFTGEGGGKLAELADWCFRMPSSNVARIQEGHELCAHLFCGLVERMMFGV